MELKSWTILLFGTWQWNSEPWPCNCSRWRNHVRGRISSMSSEVWWSDQVKSLWILSPFQHFSSVKGPNFPFFCRYLTQRFIFPISAIESNLVITGSSHLTNPLVSPSSISPVYSHASVDVFTRASFLFHLWSFVIQSTRINQAVKVFTIVFSRLFHYDTSNPNFCFELTNFAFSIPSLVI